MIDEDDERDLNGDEKDLLEEFRKNDKELDGIIDLINEGLDSLKGKTEEILSEAER